MSSETGAGFRPLRAFAAAAIFAAVLLATSIGGIAAPPTPARGMFLVAEPHLPDPRFHRSVILLIEHDRTGSLGLIVNKSTHATIAEAVPPLAAVAPDDDRFVFFGGPVALDALTFLARDSPSPKHGKPILEDVYWGGEAAALQALLEAGKSDVELRVYAGYSGWAPGQLDAEIARGDWRVVPAKTAAVFSRAPDRVWEDLKGGPPIDGIPIRSIPEESDLPPRHLLQMATFEGMTSKGHCVVRSRRSGVESFTWMCGARTKPKSRYGPGTMVRNEYRPW